MSNAYINDLNGLWRIFLEQRKKDGNVVSYRMWGNAAARKGKADLILTVEYTNWAAIDLGVEYFEEISAKLRGLVENMRQLNVAREELCDISSTFNLQEVRLKD